VIATASHFHRSLIFPGKAGAYPSGTPYVTPLQGQATSLAGKILGNGGSDINVKRSSLSRQGIN
jgi:hypothetical protein